MSAFVSAADNWHVSLSMPLTTPQLVISPSLIRTPSIPCGCPWLHELLLGGGGWSSESPPGWPWPPCAPVGAWWLVSMQMAYVALVLRSCWSTEETIEPRTVR